VVNSEVYSWDTSFGLVHPRLRYSCDLVVFCVNLGTFVFKVLLAVGMGAHERPPQLILNVFSMSPYCGLDVASMLSGGYSLNATFGHSAGTLFYRDRSSLGSGHSGIEST
jgi:hypothetical protein